MPKVSEFFGIAVYVYYREHFPPHFHAVYGDDEILVSIGDLSLICGRFAPRAVGLVMEWATIHQEELKAVWAQAMAHEPLSRIDPLK